jgi:hypothetical protein
MEFLPYIIVVPMILGMLYFLVYGVALLMGVNMRIAILPDDVVGLETDCEVNDESEV